MLLRLVNVMLLLAAVVGAILSIRAGVEYQRLRVDHRQLMNEVGLLSISDPAKVHLVAIKTDDPLTFAWQMYVPKGFTEHWRLQAGGSSSSSSGGANSESYTELTRVRLRQAPNGYWEIWWKRRSGSALSSFKMNVTADELPGLIEQLAKAGTVVVEPDEGVSLLRVWKPGERENKPLVDLRFGSTHALVADEP